jgi:HlyD family secretion protein
MIDLLKNLFALLTPDQQKHFYLLQVLVVLMSVIEIFGVASIVPFISLVTDIDQLEEKTFVWKIYQSSGINSHEQFIFLVGVCVLILLFISTITSIFTIWKLSMFASKIGTDIADRLYSHYLRQGWLFHASGSSAQLTKKISTECLRVSGGILIPLMHLNAKIVLAILMSLSIFVYDPQVALIAISIFALTYFIIFRTVRKRLGNYGSVISDVNEKRFRLMNEGFGGIKDVLLLGTDNDFISRFNLSGNSLAHSMGRSQALIQAPRYLLELIAFGSMISLILYLIFSLDSNLSKVLPILSIYAIGAIKLLPAFQQIYSSLAIIKANIAAFESIKEDLDNSSYTEYSIENNCRDTIHLKDKISLENIMFTYPNKTEPALDQINMQIPLNSVIGIVGPSGSGKSTIIDVILGLINSHDGQLKIDDQIINSHNRRSWQNSIGFVAQNIFLSEGTVAENVAFGIPSNQIDLNKVEEVLKLAHLDELVKTLNDGIHTKVGERGVQLSGGQRQRIGIARALYNNAEVLVFDEATSSLDGVTEKMIMDAIHDFSGKKTIILIAHRLKTVKKCDQIFYINEGKVYDKGTYDDLLERNEHFKKMATHS